MTSHSPSADVRHAARRWRNGIFAIFFIAGLALSSWLSRVPRIRDDLGATASHMGLLMFTLGIGSVIGLSSSSHLITRFGARPTIRVSLWVLALGMAVAALGLAGPVAPVVVVGLFVAGLGMGTCDVAMNFSGAACERDLGRTVMPLFHALFSLGTVLGAALGALAATLDIGVAPHVLTVAVLVAAGSLATVRIPVQERAVADPDAPALTWRDRLAVWTTPSTWLIGLVVLGMALTEGSANDWLSLAMVDGRGFTEAQGATMLGVFLVAMTAGRVVGTPLVDRFGRVRTVLATAIIAAVGLSMVLFIPTTPTAVIGAVLWGLGASLGFPLGMSAAAEDPESGAARLGAVSTLGYLAFLVFPPALGFLGDRVGVLDALLLVLVLIIAAAIASPALRERR
ncbi:MFS transporter [Propionibacteriaceae bacterium Y1685]